MLPSDSLSSVSMSGRFMLPDRNLVSRLIDHERGGAALNDPTQGLDVLDWVCWYEGLTVWVKPSGGEKVGLFSTDGITELSFTFDQNMRPNVAYVQRGVMHLWWWDTLTNSMRDDSFDGRSPRLALDDKRITQGEHSDIIFAYLRGDGLYYRQQRDRYATERLLRSGIHPTARLKNIGMNLGMRMQFELA